MQHIVTMTSDGDCGNAAVKSAEMGKTLWHSCLFGKKIHAKTMVP